MTLSDAALSYAFRGWPIFPCRLDKRPITTHGFKDATTDAEQVRAWWREYPSASIGYRTGDLVVVEIDGPAGMAARREQEARGLGWPVTLTALSGRADGGGHFYYQPPHGEIVRGSPQTGEGRSLGLGISVRATGQYVILPPSPHPSGRAYQWLIRREPAPLPAWMVERLKPPPPMAYEIPGDACDAYGRAALIGECDEVESATEGTLNDTLNRSAFKLGRLVRGGALRESEVREALLVAAMRNGHPERGASRTIESGLTAGMRR